MGALVLNAPCEVWSAFTSAGHAAGPAISAAKNRLLDWSVPLNPELAVEEGEGAVSGVDFVFRFEPAAWVVAGRRVRVGRYGADKSEACIHELGRDHWIRNGTSFSTGR